MYLQHMEKEMAVHKHTTKTEVKDIRLNTEINSDRLVVDQITWKQTVKDDNYEHQEEVALNSTKNGCTEPWVKCNNISEDGLESKAEKKLEQDCENSELPNTAEEFEMQNDNYSDTLNAHTEVVLSSICPHCHASFKFKQNRNDHIVRKHPEFVSSFRGKIHKCAHCPYKTALKHSLLRHMWRHPDVADELIKCNQCKKIFRHKSSLDDHIVKKHVNFIKSVSSKVHQCKLCTYKTTISKHLTRHLRKHPETADAYELSVCVHCEKRFTSKQKLDGHIVAKHPDFLMSVSSKIHKCTHCTYKTTGKTELTKHVLRMHPLMSRGATVKIEQTQEESDGVKIYKCTQCTYKTKSNDDFHKHMWKHPETTDSGKLRCMHCNATFMQKISLGNHTIRDHPEFIASISCKVHECSHCSFKTTIKRELERHLLQHPHASSSFKRNNCMHCDATFVAKHSLNDHVVKRHPEFVDSIPSKILECPKCPYKTTKRHSLNRHKMKHVNVASTMCEYCDVSFKRRETLERHITSKHPNFATFVPSKIA
nr:unnamed protein product [Callosobruchus analis]